MLGHHVTSVKAPAWPHDGRLLHDFKITAQLKLRLLHNAGEVLESGATECSECCSCPPLRPISAILHASHFRSRTQGACSRLNITCCVRIARVLHHLDASAGPGSEHMYNVRGSLYPDFRIFEDHCTLHPSAAKIRYGSESNQFLQKRQSLRYQSVGLKVTCMQPSNRGRPCKELTRRGS